MIKVYGMQGGGEVCVLALLAEAGLKEGQDYEQILVERDENKDIKPYFKAINPMNQIPAVQFDDGMVLSESGAIMMYLSDILAGKTLGFVNEQKRTEMMRWMFYIATNIYPAVQRGYYSHRFSTNPADGPNISAKAVEKMHDYFAVIANQLGQNDYLVGNKLSAVDIYFAMLYAFYLDLLPEGFNQNPALKAYYTRIVHRPAIKPIWKAGSLQL